MRAFLVVLNSRSGALSTDQTCFLHSEFDGIHVFNSSWLVPWRGSAAELGGAIRRRLPHTQVAVADVSEDWHLAA